MKSMISKTLAGLALCASLFSFTAKPGGEGFEIYLNNQVVLQQFGKDMNTVKSLNLSQAQPNDKLVVKYHHCGQAGTKRTITIKDGQNNILKEFRFADSPTPVMAMSIPVKEILNLKKGKIAELKLFYSSVELPDGRMLTYIKTGTAVNVNP
jgi:hypothetical protein